MKENNLPRTRYILPLSDFGFKRVFATESDKLLLIDLLNSCVAEDLGRITEITYLPNEHLGDRPEEKKVVFDIYCCNQNNDRFIIEMQRAKQPCFFRRVNTYVSRIISREVQSGDEDYLIPRVASINILDYEMPEFKNSDRFFWKIANKDNNNQIFSQSPAYYFIELTKFARLNKSPEKLSRLGKWLFLLKHIHEMEVPPLWVVGDTIFERMFEICSYEKLNIMERATYNKSILEYADVRDAVNYARQEGEAIGELRGEERGEELGKQKALTDTVLKMHSLELDISLIAEITSLSIEEIQAITQSKN